ncbi:ATP-binding dynein motor region D5-domain-containing protein, partial [Baffinella frigidus]
EDWAEQGLPSARSFHEGAAILTVANRTPLILDPHGVGLAWLQEHEGGNNVKAIEVGWSLIISGVSSPIDPTLLPAITRRASKRGASQYIQVGDKDLEFNPRFKLYLQTVGDKDLEFNPRFKLYLQTAAPLCFVPVECCIIDFQGTPAARKEELLELERPAMVADHSMILRHRWEFRMKQEELENTMLMNLREATPETPR